MGFHRIGVIGINGSGDRVIDTTFAPIIYSYDIKRPLDLVIHKTTKVTRMEQSSGYFHPLGEMLRDLDGPLFICLPEKMLDWCYNEINEALPPIIFEYVGEQPIIVVLALDLGEIVYPSSNRLELLVVNNMEEKIMDNGIYLFDFLESNKFDNNALENM